MEIKRFDEFVNESYEFELDYDYDDLDEGIWDSIKGAFTKPNLKDPKTAKDFGAMVSAVASKLPSSNAMTPVIIATKLVNLLTMFLNKTGPFVNRTGGPIGKKPVPMLGKDGVAKAVAGASSKAAAGAKAAGKAVAGAVAGKKK